MRSDIVGILDYRYEYEELRLKDSFVLSFVAPVIIFHDFMVFTY